MPSAPVPQAPAGPVQATYAAAPAPAAPPPASQQARPAGGSSIQQIKQQKQQQADPNTKNKGILREAAGKRWRDATLDEWPENDHRIFVGDLGNEVNDDVLGKAFQKYASFAKAKVRSTFKYL